MNNLEEVFKDIIYNYSDERLQVEDCAKKCQEIAIEFAKSLMDKETTRINTNLFDKGMVVIKEVPSEYKLLKGELIKNGDKLFDKFIEDYE